MMTDNLFTANGTDLRFRLANRRGKGRLSCNRFRHVELLHMGSDTNGKNQEEPISVYAWLQCRARESLKWPNQSTVFQRNRSTMMVKSFSISARSVWRTSLIQRSEMIKAYLWDFIPGLQKESKQSAADKIELTTACSFGGPKVLALPIQKDMM